MTGPSDTVSVTDDPAAIRWPLPGDTFTTSPFGSGLCLERARLQVRPWFFSTVFAALRVIPRRAGTCWYRPELNHHVTRAITRIRASAPETYIRRPPGARRPRPRPR